jgi:hypothetical protein
VTVLHIPHRKSAGTPCSLHSSIIANSFVLLLLILLSLSFSSSSSSSSLSSNFPLLSFNIHLSWDLVINSIRLGVLIYSLNNFLQLNKFQELKILVFVYMYSDASYVLTDFVIMTLELLPYMILLSGSLVLFFASTLHIFHSPDFGICFVCRLLFWRDYMYLRQLCLSRRCSLFFCSWKLCQVG